MTALPPQAWDALVIGELTALAGITLLTWRPLRSSLLFHAGISGLATALAWALHSGLANQVLPAALPWTPRLVLLLAGLGLAAYGRTAAEWPDAHRIVPAQLALARTQLLLGLVGTLAPAPIHVAIAMLMGILAPLTGIFMLAAALPLWRGNRAQALPMALSAICLLAGIGLLWGEQQTGPLGAGRVILRALLATQGLALALATLHRILALRREQESERLQAAQDHALQLEAKVREAQNVLQARMEELERIHLAEAVANAELHRALTQLDRLATTDRLTGAWTRRRFEEVAAVEMALVGRRKDRLCLLMLDVDHFKRVNDTWGHPVGDRVLQGLAQATRSCLRVSDAFVRWGGEEFLVMAPATPLEGAVVLAEKIRVAMAAWDFGEPGPITVSIGVAECAPGEVLEHWVGRADQALYEAKAAGRNRTMVAPPPSEQTEPLTPQAMQLIWDEDLASGIPVIDGQHQRIFGLANHLLAAVAENQPLPEVQQRMEALLAQTVRHFQDEEALMRKAGYPDLVDHQAAHAALLTQARSLEEQVQAGNLDIGDLLHFLVHGFVREHLQTEDKAYFLPVKGTLGL